MPILGLTDTTRLPRIGKIHLGTKQKKEGGREYPKASSHFIVRADDTTPAEAAQAFATVYGDEPSELDIVFPSDDPLQWADANYKSWSSYGVRCRGDGETALAKWDATGQGPRPEGVDSGTWANSNTKEGAWAYLQIPCAGEDCPMQRVSPPKCKMVMNLQFLLPDVAGVGVWQIDTSSKHSVLNILNNVRLIQAVTGGRIRGLPLRLRLVPKQVTPDGGKTKTVYVLDIYAALTLTELMRRVAALPERGLVQLPPPDDAVPDDLFPGVDEETGEIIEAEATLQEPEPSSDEAGWVPREMAQAEHGVAEVSASDKWRCSACRATNTGGDRCINCERVRGAAKAEVAPEAPSEEAAQAPTPFE